MHFVYILYSKSADKYYIGETENLATRLHQHNIGYFKGSFTSLARDWEIYFKIECQDIQIARKIERHIKKMKSRKYLENLVKYNSITEKLIEKYTLNNKLI